jgi:hypothetical protein
MKCSDCGYDKNPESARFCVGCGRRLIEGRETRIEVMQSVGQVAEGGRATAFQVEKMTGNVTMNVVQVNLPPEILAKLAAVSTEVQASSTRSHQTTVPGASAAADATEKKGSEQKDRESVHHVIGELLKVAEAEGTQVINVGGVETSRAELLLKKAVLLKTDAEQIMLDNAIAIAKAQQAGQQPPAAAYDERAVSAKFKEAYSLLEQALQLDASNTEVMLHMVQILSETNTGDTREGERMLFRIQSLLNPPKNDTEKFRLAQAKFLQGVLPGSPHPPSIQAARAMFEQLGRIDWVQQCDFVLQRAAPPGMVAPGAPAIFQPVGRWQVRANDGSVALVELYPNGSFASTLQGGVYGYGAQSAGQWGFIPANNFLRFQGLVNGFMPFDLGMAIQGQQNGMYMATGTDGKMYLFQRLA